MRIETNRLILREMTIKDQEALSKIFSDEETMKYYPYVFNESEVYKWIIKNIDRYNTFGFGLWAVCLKDTNELIGDCGLTLQLINNEIKPEIGYHIRKDMQRKGYAKESTIAVRDFIFHNTPFNTIYSYMNEANIPSILTALSYGCRFSFEYKDKSNELVKVYKITREEWCNLKK